MAKTVYVIIACDTDPDRAGFNSDISKDGLAWRGMLEGIPTAKERLKEHRDAEGKSPVFTWCIRVDHQVERLCGEIDYVLKTYHDFLQGLIYAGDELAWHPHFWKYDESGQVWYQEFNDKAWQKTMLEKGHSAFEKNFPGMPRSVRMGWDYHSQESFATLSRLGLKVDLSAIPGQRLIPRSSDTKGSNFYDWYESPRYPFNPSIADYRRPAVNGEDAYSTMEFPVFTTDSRFWGMFGSAVLAMKMKDPLKILNGIRRPSYFINITGNPTLFNPLLSQLKRDLATQDDVYFVTYFHADEVLDTDSRLYSLDYMDTNLANLNAQMSRFEAKMKYLRACDLANHFSTSQ